MLIFAVITMIILIAADQLIKLWAASRLMPIGEMDFLKIGSVKIMDLTYVQNDGAAFSSFSGKKYFLIILTAVMIIALAIFAVREYVKGKNKNPFMLFSTAAVVAGGIGNLIDRIRLGYVIDYFNMKLFRFAVFNFADVCVVVGAACLLICVILSEKKEHKNK